MNQKMKNKKLQAYKRGHAAEKLAALYLQLRGYKILKTRYKTPMGEIDLVARKGNALVMVEVKRRREMNTAIEAVTPKNQYRVGQAARYFLSAHPALAGLDLRFDIIVMGVPFYWRHLDNAWQAPT